MTKLYLAWSSRAHDTLTRHVADGPVDLLVAFPELASFARRRDQYHIGSWFLDSGAFSAWNSGRRIDLADYIAACRDVDAAEVAGLDVIGDGDATRRNLEAMWAAGVRAIPTFHYGGTEQQLAWCLASAPKIALGGVAKLPPKRRLAWIKQCFARAWPKAIHGFGVASVDALEAVPFHSVDASSWTYAPSACGAYAGYTGRQISLSARGIRDFWIEVEEHRRRARRAAARWRRQLAELP